MSDWIDVTVPLRPGIPQWPGDPLLSMARVCELARGDEANVTAISLCAHTGTHVDAPVHYIDGAGGVESIDLGRLIGAATVADINDPLPVAERLLFRTEASNREWWTEPYTDRISGLTADKARRIVVSGTKTVGIDYLTIGDAAVHLILLAAGICVIEGLDLTRIAPGSYEMICLPMKLQGADGAPARVLLRPR